MGMCICSCEYKTVQDNRLKLFVRNLNNRDMVVLGNMNAKVGRDEIGEIVNGKCLE